MSSVLEAKETMQALWPAHKYGKQTNAIWAAYTTLSRKVSTLTHRMTRTLYHGEGTFVRSEIMDALREEKVRRNAAREQAKLIGAAECLERVDPHFYQEQIDFLRRVSAETGGEN